MAGKDRKKQLARQRFARQEARRRAQEARARRIRIIGAVVAVAVVAGGAGGFMVLAGKDDKAEPASPQAKADGTCTYSDAAGDKGAPEDLGKPPAEPAYTAPVNAAIKTNRGDIEVRLDGAKAPCTTNSFAFLAQQDFYKDSSCHRLSTSEGLRMLQCGDPTGTGQGGPGYKFADENLDGATYPKGTLAMANSGPGTNGSQFFLVYGDSQLPPNYTVFGKITKGVQILEQVAKAGIDKPGGDGTGKPKKEVTIEGVAIAGK